MTKLQYEKWTKRLKDNEKLCKGLLFSNKILTSIYYLLFPVLILLQYALQLDWLFSLIAAAVSFVLISIFRRLYNKPRPYEKLIIDPIIKRNKSGCSFPSRHVFSVYVIATLWFLYIPYVGIALMILGIFLAIVRVSGGVHYPIDVIFGALFGIISIVICSAIRDMIM